jgi:hypothetical protein
MSLALLAALALPPAAPAAWFQEAPAEKPLAELPMNPDAAKAAWEVPPGLKAVRDEVLGREVLECAGRAPAEVRLRAPPQGEAWEVEARLRLLEGAAMQGATLAIGAAGDGAAGAASLTARLFAQRGDKAFVVVRSFGGEPEPADAAKEPGPHKPRAPRPQTVVAERYRDVSPVWDAGYRREIEWAMSRVPLARDTWFTLRIVRRPGLVQLYRDDLLIAENRPQKAAAGSVSLQLSGVARVASLVVRKLDAPPAPFHPVPLDAACNAKAEGALALAAGALPPPGKASVGPVPFLFPAAAGGRDHLHVGESLFHTRNQEGQFEGNVTWPTPFTLDPNRLRFSVPVRPWVRLWLVAAFDGEPNRVPVVTARFYRALAGFPVDAAATVPGIVGKADAGRATPLPVKLAGGKAGNLWLVPVELDAVRIASEFRDEEYLSLELTKEVFPHRDYPDPANYSWYPGGLPSGVRVFAMTLEEAPVRLLAGGARWGNTWVAPEKPAWRVDLQNLRPRKADARLRVTVVDPFGKTHALQRAVALAPNGSAREEFPLPAGAFGLHQVRAEAELAGGGTFAQEGTFVLLPPDTRKATGAKSRWGVWNWFGGHLTNPNEDEVLAVNRAVGARYGGSRDPKKRAEYGMANAPQHLSSPPPELRIHGPAKWALKEPHDPAEYQAFSDGIGKKVAKKLEQDPDTPSFSVFTEAAVSPRLTYGVPPEYLGEGEFQMTPEEQKRFKAFMLTLKAATEGIRKHAPKAKIALGWCEPYFAAPFLKEKFPREMFDFIGVDAPQFERLPEMPIRELSPNRMWLLQQALKKHGYGKVPVIHTESYYPSSHPLALGFRKSADSVVRTAVLSLALGSTTFANCWTLQDCANFWGAQHYGCVGLVGRQPEANPKPALAAYATMTRLLDEVEYEGRTPTGSASAYCLRFAAGASKVHCLWTLRGPRPARLVFPRAAEALLVDENGNETKLPLKDLAAEVTLTPTPFWVVTPADAPIQKVELGEPSYADAPSGPTKPLDPLDKPWKLDPAGDAGYAGNHWGAPRYAGPMRSEAVDAPGRRAKAWQVTLDPPPKERPLAAWYGAFSPPRPIPVPGRARALGLWVHGRSNWGRIAYEIEDARGERWQSIGTKDDWTCDDPHGWSYFNFDGWRYVEFPLPSHEPGDHYRSADTTWWNHSAEGVVDLPVKLTRVFVEHRTHNIYVDELVEVPDRSVHFSDLVAVYDRPEAMTDAPVLLQRAAAGVLRIPAADESAMENPLARLAREGAGAPPSIAKVAPPEHGYDGTRVDVTLDPVSGAKEYRVYVSAYESGAGAKPMAKGAQPLVPVAGLRAEVPLWIFATSVDAQGRESKPTAAKRLLLKDDFPMK